MPLMSWDDPASAFDAPRLAGLRKAGLALFFLALVLLGAATEMRGAFMARRMTDADVYFRAAWAVTSGRRLYDVTDNNGWHYHYPPLLAILLVPFADPPAGEAAPAFALPYPVAIGFWYVINLAFALGACHLLANALETGNGAFRRPPPGSTRWWALRIWPFLFLLAPIGETLGHGQTNLIGTFAIAACAAALARGREFKAGAWLAAAAAIKLFPGLLALELLRRKQGMALLGLAAALVAGLGLIPVLTLGPARTLATYRDFMEERVLSWAEGRVVAPVRAELLDPAQAGLVPLQVMLLKTAYPDPASRPAAVPPLYRWLHWSLGAGLVAATLIAAGKRRHDGADDASARERLLLTLGALAVLGALLMPSAQTHYFTVALPIATALVWRGWRRRPEIRFFSVLHLPLLLYMAVTLLLELPGLRQGIDIAAEGWAALGLWGAAIGALLRDPRAAMVSVNAQGHRERLPAFLDQGTL